MLLMNWPTGRLLGSPANLMTSEKAECSSLESNISAYPLKDVQIANGLFGVF